MAFLIWWLPGFLKDASDAGRARPPLAKVCRVQAGWARSAGHFKARRLAAPLKKTAFKLVERIMN